MTLPTESLFISIPKDLLFKVSLEFWKFFLVCNAQTQRQALPFFPWCLCASHGGLSKQNFKVFRFTKGNVGLYKHTSQELQSTTTWKSMQRNSKEEEALPLMRCGVLRAATTSSTHATSNPLFPYSICSTDSYLYVRFLRPWKYGKYGKDWKSLY